MQYGFLPDHALEEVPDIVTLITLTDHEGNELVVPVDENVCKVFEELIKPRTREGISVEVSHYNPLRDEDINVVYDAGRKKNYDANKRQLVTKNK